MDWAAMVMNMYSSWAQRRGYTVSIIEEMPGEIAGIKVYIPSHQLPLLNLLLLHSEVVSVTSLAGSDDQTSKLSDLNIRSYLSYSQLLLI